MEQKPCERCGKLFPTPEQLENKKNGQAYWAKRRFCSQHCNLLGNTRRRGLVVKPVADRFWEKVKRGGPDECWPWLGAVDGCGYGVMYRTRTPKITWYKSNRLAYELQVGPIPPKMQALHTCDNPPCCNGKHLYPGTPLQNARDRASRGRGKENRQQGEANDNAKLTEENVRAIIARLQETPRKSQIDIAWEFGVKQPQISRIMHRKLWKHLWEE